MSLRRSIGVSFAHLTLASLATMVWQPSAAHAALIVGADYGGTDLAPADGDYLQGTFTNVGTFRVPENVTVLIDPGTTLSITAVRAEVDGTIDGTGAGADGGPGGDHASGSSGSGPGGGGGGPTGFFDTEPAGGGGAGHAGEGGASGHRINPGGPSGPTYGVAGPPTFDQGSGGGGAGGMTGFYSGVGGDGGGGGAAISITAGFAVFGPTSLISVNGEAGQTGTPDVSYGCSGGGGGSGGTILLSANNLSLEGTLSAEGGDGGDRVSGTETGGAAASGGGGGGGGRIKLVGANSFCDLSTKLVSGGTAGDSDASVYEEAAAGVAGTVSTTGSSATCCGNGVVDGGEECDDGDDACCSEFCEPQGSGDPCPSDGIVCTHDVCDAGACTHPGAPIESGCLIALGGSKFQLATSYDQFGDVLGGKLSWTWKNGDAFDQAVLGDPLDDTTYTLCVYEYIEDLEGNQTPFLAIDLETPPSDTLWKSKDPKGVQYKSTTGEPEGVTKMSLKTGLFGRTKMKFAATGADFLPPVARQPNAYFRQQPKLTVQLFNNEGGCWEASYTPEDNKVSNSYDFKAQVKP